MGIDVNQAMERSSSASSLTIRTKGFRTLEDALRSFANDFDYKSTQKNVLVPAVRAAVKPIASAIKAFAPRSSDAGREKYKDPKAAKHLQDTIAIRARVPNAKDRRSSYIVGNEVVIGEASVFTDQRAISQEFGNVRTGKQEYLRRSVTYAAVAALDTFENTLLAKIATYRDKNKLTLDPR